MRPKLFEDDQGNPSSLRVLVFIFTIYCILAATYVLLIWGYIAIKTQTFPELHFSDLITIGIGAAAMMAKAVQKKFEVDSSCCKSNGEE